MADFGINATQMSQPSLAGTDPVAPVQEQAVNTTPWAVINTIGETFARGLQAQAKEQAKAKETAVMKEYSNKISRINDALSRQAISPSEASARTRAINNEYAAGYPEYIESLKKSADFFQGKTEIGEAENQIAMERKIREKDITDAASTGFVFYPGMPQDAQDKAIAAFKMAQQTNYQFDQQRKRAEEQRAVRSDQRSQASSEMQIQDWQDRKNSVQQLVGLASTNFDASQSLYDGLLNNSSIPFEQKVALAQQNLSRINVGLQAVAANNPGLADGWKQIFNDMHSTFVKLADPKTQAEGKAAELKAQYDALITQGKLLAVSENPQVYKLAVADSLLKDPNLVTLYGSATVADWLKNTSFANEDGSIKIVKPVIGTPELKPTVQSFDQALSNLYSNKVGDKETATMQATNIANQLLKESALYGGDLLPAQLKDMANFFAGSNFGKLAKEGKLSSQQMQGAKQMFQTNYEPVVQQAIMERLMRPNGDGKFIDGVDIKFSGDGVKFTQKDNVSFVGELVDQVKSLANPAQRITNAFQRDQEITKAEKGLNQLIHIGAHLEGTTDYEKYWESNKHIILPELYPDPNRLKTGQVVNGFKYIGGYVADKRNWIKEPSSTAEKK